jgi:hypothetical protein
MTTWLREKQPFPTMNSENAGEHEKIAGGPGARKQKKQTHRQVNVQYPWSGHAHRAWVMDGLPAPGRAHQSRTQQQHRSYPGRQLSLPAPTG